MMVNHMLRAVFICFSIGCLFYSLLQLKTSRVLSSAIKSGDYEVIYSLRNSHKIHHGLVKGRNDFLFLDELLATFNLNDNRLEEAYSNLRLLVAEKINDSNSYAMCLLVGTILDKNVKQVLQRCKQLNERFPYNRNLNIALSYNTYERGDVHLSLDYLKKGIIGRESIFYALIEARSYSKIFNRPLINELEDLIRKEIGMIALSEVLKNETKSAIALNRNCIIENDKAQLNVFSVTDHSEYQEWLGSSLLSELLSFLMSLDKMDKLDIDSILPFISRNYYHQFRCKRENCPNQKVLREKLLQFLKTNLAEEDYRIAKWRSYQIFKY